MQKLLSIKMPKFNKHSEFILIALIFVLAALPRFIGSRFGLPYLYHYDEPQTASNAIRILQTGDYNPHFFNYGSLLIYLSAVVDVFHYFFLMLQSDGYNTLRDLNDIRTEYNSGYHWTISHPSFFLWNRYLVALMGASSVVVVYYLVKLIKGVLAGVIAAFILVNMLFHIYQSTYITTDLPSSFLILCAITFAALYLKQGQTLHYILSLVCCGLATSMKYNSAVFVIIPCIALIYQTFTKGFRFVLWMVTPFVVTASFLVGTPYALLDLPHFLHGVGSELYHYKTLGHGVVATVNPGIDQLVLQTTLITRNNGLFVMIFFLIGLFALLRNNIGRMLIVVPCIALILVCGTRVAFNRNTVIVYPVIASIAGIGIAVLGDIVVKRLSKYRNARIYMSASAIIALMCCLFWYSITINTYYTSGMTIDTRTKAVNEINSLVRQNQLNIPKVGIADELRIHQNDLLRLEADYQLLPYQDIICNAASYGAVVLPVLGESRWDITIPGNVVTRASEINNVILKNVVYSQELTSIDVSSTSIPNDPTVINAPSVFIAKFAQVGKLPVECTETSNVALDNSQDNTFGKNIVEVDNTKGLLSITPEMMTFNHPFGVDNNTIEMPSWGILTTPELSIQPGSYRFRWMVSGEKIDVSKSDTPQVRAIIREHLVDGETRIIDTRVIGAFPWIIEMSSPFSVSAHTRVSLELEFINGVHPAGVVGPNKVRIQGVVFEPIAQFSGFWPDVLDDNNR